MNKNEINLKIAECLGFKCDVSGHWTYPKEWENYVASIPNYSIPDFLEIIDIFLLIHKRCLYSIPKVFNVKPEIKLKMEE